MGLKCIQSIGEAEALCAALNEKGVSAVLFKCVDVCLNVKALILLF